MQEPANPSWQASRGATLPKICAHLLAEVVEAEVAEVATSKMVVTETMAAAETMAAKQHAVKPSWP
jgi:hypothetical protein